MFRAHGDLLARAAERLRSAGFSHRPNLHTFWHSFTGERLSSVSLELRLSSLTMSYRHCALWILFDLARRGIGGHAQPGDRLEPVATGEIYQQDAGVRGRRSGASIRSAFTCPKGRSPGGPTCSSSGEAWHGVSPEKPTGSHSRRLRPLLRHGSAAMMPGCQAGRVVCESGLVRGPAGPALPLPQRCQPGAIPVRCGACGAKRKALGGVEARSGGAVTPAIRLRRSAG